MEASLPPEDVPGGSDVQRYGIVRNVNGQQPKLPQGGVFKIQIGSELFQLSGASISSDGPSYFTRFFDAQLQDSSQDGNIRTLNIDRDPVVFRDIARHLQGYYIQPSNGSHFVRLFADVHFYSLPRLISQLCSSEIFIQIGERHFQVPRDIFSAPGDSPNYFTLGFGAFFSTPEELFPGLDKTGLVRPPPMRPPCMPSRSPEVFSQLLHMLRGYPLHIRNQDHRAELLRDCRYYNLRGLEQKLIAHTIGHSWDRNVEDIVLQLHDVASSGLSIKSDGGFFYSTEAVGWMVYKRPFVDEKHRELVFEIGSDTELNLCSGSMRLRDDAAVKVSSLMHSQTTALKSLSNCPVYMGKLHPVAGTDCFKMCFSLDPNCDLTLNDTSIDVEEALQGIPQSDGSTTKLALASSITLTAEPAGRKRKLDQIESPVDGEHKRKVCWRVRKAQWKVKIVKFHTDEGELMQGFLLVAVKLDAYSSERARHRQRGFLS